MSSARFFKDKRAELLSCLFFWREFVWTLMPQKYGLETDPKGLPSLPPLLGRFLPAPSLLSPRTWVDVYDWTPPKIRSQSNYRRLGRRKTPNKTAHISSSTVVGRVFFGSGGNVNSSHHDREYPTRLRAFPTLAPSLFPFAKLLNSKLILFLRRPPALL